MNPGSYLLQQSLASTGTSFCSGGGNINSTKVYNGSFTSSVQLLNSAGTVIAELGSGNFSNITAGTYTTRMKIVPFCSELTPTINSRKYSCSNRLFYRIQITSSVGVVCER